MEAISVGGSRATAATEKILMIWFCSRLIRPRVASIRKVTLDDMETLSSLSAAASRCSRRTVWRASRSALPPARAPDSAA